MVIRLMKVKAHCGELLNEAADALASAAAEVDDSIMVDALHLDPDAVQSYIRDCPVGWGTQVRNHLTHLAGGQATAAMAVPKTRRDGTVRIRPITLAWFLRQDQGGRVLGQALKAMRTDKAKWHALQTIVGSFPGNALLCRWKLQPTATCNLCSSPAEIQAQIQLCPCLMGARIAAHRKLAGMVFDRVRDAGQGWTVHGTDYVLPARPYGAAECCGGMG